MINYYNKKEKEESILLRFKQSIKKKILSEKNHVYIGKKVKFTNTSFQGNNKIFSNTDIEGASIGYASYIGARCYLPKAKIGKFCSIAPDVQVVMGNHPIDQFISTHPAFYSMWAGGNFTYVNQNYFYPYRYVGSNKKSSIEIGNDVWIGKNVLIMEGVTIGDGAIIGTGSLVLKDIPPYSVYAGNPARLIRKRFSDQEIMRLLKIKWWNKNQKWIEDNADLFRNKAIFLQDID